jgi:hypothetical protein
LQAESLERGYRRLLASYPARHRQVHGEEMLGVLMALAPDGKRRPGLAESLDLLRAALVIRLRSRRAADPGGGWRYALAVFSVRLRLRWAAALVSWAATMYMTLWWGIIVYYAFSSGSTGGNYVAIALFAYAAQTVALVGSPGPRRGLRLLTWRAWALTVTAAAAGGVAWLALSFSARQRRPGRRPARLGRRVT